MGLGAEEGCQCTGVHASCASDKLCDIAGHHTYESQVVHVDFVVVGRRAVHKGADGQLCELAEF